jgi:16S rRNA (cytosine967-C5)-methyltransferase
MVSRWIAQFGEETAVLLCQANNNAPKTSARVNLLKHTPIEMIEILRQEGMEAVSSILSTSGIIVEHGGNLAFSRWFKEGSITIQDESSMLVADVVHPLPGMRVLDCCAAPGGKTTHLAEKMNDAGTIVACDVHPHKIALVQEQALRLNLHAIETIQCDAADLPLKYAEASFDCILLDAPCSGLGVIRRKPDLKWSKQEQEIADIAALQNKLLNAVHTLLRPGGLLVYSTCTMEYDENQGMINRFLQHNPDYTLEAFPKEMLSNTHELKAEAESGMLQILPHYYGSDGFFIARMRKKTFKTGI